MSVIMDLRSKRNALWEQTKAFLEEHRAENGMVEASAVEQYDKMTAEVMALGEEIKRLEAQLEMDNKFSEATSQAVHNDPKPHKNLAATATEEYKNAFWAAMKGDTSAEIRNVLTTGTGEGSGGGGYTVPDEFHKQLVEALEENNIIRSIAHVIRTNSGVRSIPIAADGGAASWVEEGGQIQESDLSFSNKTLSAYKLSCMVKVSNELLNDSAFDIASHIAKRFGVRFGNAEEEAFIKGTGVSTNLTTTPSQPTGFLTSLTKAGATTSNAASITFDDVIKLYYALKAPYRRKAVFLANEATLLRLMLLKDKNDNYIWKPALEVGKPDTVLGHTIYTSTYMPTFTTTAANDAGKKVLVFGDFSYYYIADRTSRTLKRLNELYAVNDQTAFIGTQRVDGKLVLDEAMQYLALGANG